LGLSAARLTCADAQSCDKSDAPYRNAEKNITYRKMDNETVNDEELSLNMSQTRIEKITTNQRGSIRIT
jgi:hypothetical protein